MHCPVDRFLSGRVHYPTFEQPGQVCQRVICQGHLVFIWNQNRQLNCFCHLCSLEIYQILNLRSPVPSIENSFIKCASSCLCVFYERTKKQQKQLPVVILTFKTKAVLRQLVIHDLKLSNDSHRYEAYLNRTLVQGFLIF